MILRASLAAIAALLVGIEAVRATVATELAQSQPPAGASLGVSHPGAALRSLVRDMALVQPPAVMSSSNIYEAAKKEPLAPEPFLMAGTTAQLAGDGDRAQRLIEAAQWRDPRSVAAARFLARRYVQTGNLDRGLVEVAALARLGDQPSAKSFVVGYAADQSAWPKIRTTLEANPQLRDAVLMELATNSRTVRTALALADPRGELMKASWFAAALETLTADGEYQEAHQLWLRATATKRAGELLHDGAFNDAVSPPPFNWTLASSSSGFAERQRGGGLHVVYAGRDAGFLASEMLLLPRGSYMLTMKWRGDPSQPLSWSIWCDKSPAPLASSTAGAVASHGLHFVVPANCPSQWLRLGGAPLGIAQKTEATIYSLNLAKADMRA